MGWNLSKERIAGSVLTATNFRDMGPFLENRNENKNSGNRGSRWQPVAASGRMCQYICPGWRVVLTPSVHCGHLLSKARVDLRIRRLGVRIPPSALQKSRSELWVPVRVSARRVPWAHIGPIVGFQ